MYSPANKNNNIVRIGVNKKKHIIKDTRYIKTEMKKKL